MSKKQSKLPSLRIMINMNLSILFCCIKFAVYGNTYVVTYGYWNLLFHLLICVTS